MSNSPAPGCPTEIQLLADLYASPELIGRALRLLSGYVRQARIPPAEGDLELLLTISVAEARAKARP